MSWARSSVFPDAITARRSERTQRNLGIRKPSATSIRSARPVVVAVRALRPAHGMRMRAVDRNGVACGTRTRTGGFHGYFTVSPVLRVSRSGTVQFTVQPRRPLPAFRSWRGKTPGFIAPGQKPPLAERGASADRYISRPDTARNPFVLCIFSRVLAASPALAPGHYPGVRLPVPATPHEIGRCPVAGFLPRYSRRRTRLLHVIRGSPSGPLRRASRKMEHRAGVETRDLAVPLERGLLFAPATFAKGFRGPVPNPDSADTNTLCQLS